MRVCQAAKRGGLLLLDLVPILLQVCKANAYGRQRRLHALKLDGDGVVVPCPLEYAQALLHRHVAVAYDCAPQIVARPGLERALAGVVVIVALDDEVFCVDIAGVGGKRIVFIYRLLSALSTIPRTVPDR